MLTRRYFLAATGLAAGAAEAPKPVPLLTSEEARRMKAFAVRDRRAVIEKMARGALSAGPWSVTFHRPTGLDIVMGPNDYVSEAPYWFPDPRNPGGPYIRRDGEYNTGRFTAHVNDLRAMSAAVLSLGMGAYFLGDPQCNVHAAKVLSTWFMDPATRMNPNLEHGQLIRGVNTGRGAGMIDTQSLIHAVHGIDLLERTGKLDAAIQAGLRNWFADYADWMNTSRHGKSEKKAGNNHSTWWTTQIAAYSLFTGNTALRRMAWSHCRDFLIPSEIQADGSCPREEERTRSLHYSSMNLDAFALLCRLASLDGVDLWRYRTPAGTGVETAFLYLLPFTLEPETWKKRQIDKYDPGAHYFTGLGGIALRSQRLLPAYLATPRASAPWVQFVDILVRATAH